MIYLVTFITVLFTELFDKKKGNKRNVIYFDYKDGMLQYIVVSISPFITRKPEASSDYCLRIVITFTLFNLLFTFYFLIYL